MGQVHEVHRALPEKIRAAIENQELARRELRRRLAREHFAFQTLGDILDGAEGDLMLGVPIETQQFMREGCIRCLDPDVRRDLHDRYFSAEHVGAFCAVPANKSGR